MAEVRIRLGVFTVRVNETKIHSDLLRLKERLFREMTLGTLADTVRAAIHDQFSQASPPKMPGQAGNPAEGFSATFTQQMAEQGVVTIGSIQGLNAATPMKAGRRGAWRFGWWFNLEWGREFPHRGDSFVFQENPGPASYPGAPDDRPPGATLDHIRILNWIQRGVPPGHEGGSGGSGIKLTAAIKGRGAFGALSDAQQASFLHADRIRRQTPSGKRLGSGTAFGFHGQAPMRVGYQIGISVAEAKLGAVLEKILKESGSRG